ncbi:hypothetical protein Pint_00902 [Pistacia integerrima]|uniref:Uncharacterized protein n=1 Tax=Pistacia integerrima TaxID=434235 RepID=A0ACC0ZJ00_9ROSI|nr:hypothetical protein Pint_00902 [Pistacia integerrima]
MEHISGTNVVTIRNGKNKMVNDQGLRKSKKKMGGVVHFVRLALYMLRRKSKKSKASMEVDVSSTGPWTEVLASMRPLHAGSSQCPPPSDEMPMSVPMIEKFEDVLTPPLSPAPTKTLAPPCESDDGMSQYASAQDLQELDTATTADDNEENNDNGGDEMIDVKAEEFIAQFYEQMRIQNVHYMNTHNRRLRQTS